jgi:hypothetical protein
MRFTIRLLIIAIYTSLIGPSHAFGTPNALTVSDTYVDDIDTDDLEKTAKKALDRLQKSSKATPTFKALIEKKENLPYLMATSRETVIFDRIKELGAEEFTKLCEPESHSTLTTCLNEIFNEIAERHSLTTTGLALGSSMIVIYGAELKNGLKKSNLKDNEKKKKLDELELEILRTQLMIVKIIVQQKPKMITVTRPDTLKSETTLREQIKNQLTTFIKDRSSRNKVVADSSIPKELDELIKSKN